MKITDPQWEVLCEDKAQMNKLLDYAEQKGLRIELSARVDECLAFSGSRDATIYSFPEANVNHIFSAAKIEHAAFRQLCDDYANTKDLK